MKARPYGIDTVFGYTALLDNEENLKKSIVSDDNEIEINEGEDVIMSMLLKGQFYSHTGKQREKLRRACPQILTLRISVFI